MSILSFFFFSSLPFASDIRRARNEIGVENTAGDLLSLLHFFLLCHFFFAQVFSPSISRPLSARGRSSRAAELNKIYLVGRGSRGIPAHTVVARRRKCIRIRCDATRKRRGREDESVERSEKRRFWWFRSKLLAMRANCGPPSCSFPS